MMTDRKFLAAFRSDPKGTLQPYGLSQNEIEAVKAGDEQKLAGLGADLSQCLGQGESRPLSRSLLLRLGSVPLALALFAGAAAAHSTPARAAARTFGTRAAARVLDGKWQDTGLGEAREKQRELEEGPVGHELPLPFFTDLHNENQ